VGDAGQLVIAVPAGVALALVSLAAYWLKRRGRHGK